MSQRDVAITTEWLQAFADAWNRPNAWNRHDADAIMPFMSDDCVFEASAGPDICGARSDGARVEVHGCDLFRFREGKIILKDSYRKSRPPIPSLDR